MIQINKMMIYGIYNATKTFLYNLGKIGKAKILQQNMFIHVTMHVHLHIA